MKINTDELEVSTLIDHVTYTGTVSDNTPRNHWDGDIEVRVVFWGLPYHCNGITYRLDVTIKQAYAHADHAPRLLEECRITRTDGREATDAGRRFGWQLCRDLRDAVEEDFDAVRELAIQARINRCAAEAKRHQIEAEKWVEAGLKIQKEATA